MFSSSNSSRTAYAIAATTKIEVTVIARNLPSFLFLILLNDFHAVCDSLISKPSARVIMYGTNMASRMYIIVFICVC